MVTLSLAESNSSCQQCLEKLTYFLIHVTCYYIIRIYSDMESNVLARVMTKKGICLNILINSRDFIISFLSNGNHTYEWTPDLKETKSIKITQ